MNFSIFYRVVWNPAEVFKLFRGKPRLEPYIFIGALVLLQDLKQYWGHFETIATAPFALVMNLLIGFLLFMLFPIVNAVVVTIIVSIMHCEKPSFLSLLSAFILCALPYYIEAMMVLILGYKPIGLGSFSPSLENSSPFAFGMVGTVTPFFLWAIALWWFAVKQLLLLQQWNDIFIVASLVLVNIILGGWLWRMASMVTR